MCGYWAHNPGFSACLLNGWPRNKPYACSDFRLKLIPWANLNLLIIVRTRTICRINWFGSTCEMWYLLLMLLVICGMHLSAQFGKWSRHVFLYTSVHAHSHATSTSSLWIEITQFWSHIRQLWSENVIRLHAHGWRGKEVVSWGWNNEG